MNTEFNDMPVARATFEATVTFEAYVAVNPDGTISTTRVAHEIADAIEYRAVHLHDSEDGDVLIALVGGGSGTAADVHVRLVSATEDDVTTDVVTEAVESTEAWL